MALHSKAKLNGYPIILGRPYLAIIDAIIGSIYKDMIISQENSKDKLTLYPLDVSILDMG